MSFKSPIFAFKWTHFIFSCLLVYGLGTLCLEHSSSPWLCSKLPCILKTQHLCHSRRAYVSLLSTQKELVILLLLLSFICSLFKLHVHHPEVTICLPIWVPFRLRGEFEGKPVRSKVFMYQFVKMNIIVVYCKYVLIRRLWPIHIASLIRNRKSY